VGGRKPTALAPPRLVAQPYALALASAGTAVADSGGGGRALEHAVRRTPCSRILPSTYGSLHLRWRPAGEHGGWVAGQAVLASHSPRYLFPMTPTPLLEIDDVRITGRPLIAALQ
jgi:hypothetical protein